MSRDVQEAITSYVRQQLEDETVKAFSVVWYGGEPLLKKDVIAGLSEAFMNICKANEVTYNASIITNGYLVDEETAKLLKDCSVSFAQVTGNYRRAAGAPQRAAHSQSLRRRGDLQESR